MKIAHALGVVLAAAVVPAVASAQSTTAPPSTTTTTTTTTNSNGTTSGSASAGVNAGVNGTGVSAGAGVNAGAQPSGTPNTVPSNVPTDPNAVPPPPPPPTTTVTTESTPPPVVVVQPSANTTVPTYQPETEEEYDAWNAPVFTTGAVLFGGSYAASAIVSSESDHPGANRLWVPVAGPWLALNDWGNCPIEQPRCDTNTTDKVLLVADGVVQAVGILGMVDGLLMPSHHKVIRRTADTKVHVTPTGNGFAVFGRF